MTSRVRRILFTLLVLALAASACSSSGDDAAQVDADDTDTAEASPTAAAEPGDSTAEPTTIPVPADDTAADAAVAGLDGDAPAEGDDADPGTTAQTFVRARFNIDPDPAWVSCMVAQTGRDSDLEAALDSPAVALGEVDDTQLRALTFAMNGCIDTLSLADWATQAIGPQGDVEETAPPCLVERFDAEDGDTVFYNFAALTYQYRLEPDGIDGLVDALATCAPITSLSGFFANQAEQATGSVQFVDLDCLNELLSPDEVSREFWDVFVAGGVPPVDFITPFTDQCLTDPEIDERAATVPTDFVAWSGTGELAAVAPNSRAGIYDAPPPQTLDAGADYEAVLATGGGEIRIRLYADTAPVTVNNFVSLARDGYYDGTIFHRVIEDFMAQGGDPTGTGSGGPGYQFQDEFDGGPALDRKGLLAMANSGANTNGSQFFITFVPTDYLTGSHTVFGEVIEGIEIVDTIQLRDPAVPGPAQTLDSVTIIETPAN